jgi:hypothetical protein
LNKSGQPEKNKDVKEPTQDELLEKGQNTFLFSCESLLRMRANNWNDLLSPHKVDFFNANNKFS